MARIAALLFLLIAGPAGATQWLLADEDGKNRPATVEALLAAHPLAAGDNIKVAPLARSGHSAQFLVQVRNREPLHYHADSDITVFLLRGRGVLRIARRELPVAAGDTLHIPRGVIHAYINKGPEVAVAIVSYGPAPGAEDRVLIKE